MNITELRRLHARIVDMQWRLLDEDVQRLLNALPALLDRIAELEAECRRRYRHYTEAEVRECWERGEQLEADGEVWEHARPDRQTKLPDETPQQHMRWECEPESGCYSLITSHKLSLLLLRPYDPANYTHAALRGKENTDA